MNSRRQLLWSLLTAGFLSACAVPPARVGEGLAQQASAGGVASFDLSARFSLQFNPPSGQEQRQFSGRLQWQHGPLGDKLLFMDPLGQGVAELQRPALGPVLLQLADGTRREADDPDQLIGEVLGVPLPLGELAGWVQAIPGPGALMEPDAQGRPRRVRESGWLLFYHYGDGEGEFSRLPARLDASLDGVLKLRLSFEAWEPLP